MLTICASVLPVRSRVCIRSRISMGSGSRINFSNAAPITRALWLYSYIWVIVCCMHPSYQTFSKSAYASSFASGFSQRRFRALTYPVIDLGCTPDKVPSSLWIFLAAAYLSIKELIQWMVLSSLRNFSGWSCNYTWTRTHQVSKNCTGFLSNHSGSWILIGFANSNSLNLLYCRDILLPLGSAWSDGGGSGSPPPSAAFPSPAPAFPSLELLFLVSQALSCPRFPSQVFPSPALLPAPAVILSIQVQVLSVSLKLDMKVSSNISLFCGCTFPWPRCDPDGLAVAGWLHNSYGIEFDKLYTSIDVVNPVLTSPIWAIWASIVGVCNRNTHLERIIWYWSRYTCNACIDLTNPLCQYWHSSLYWLIWIFNH